MTVKDLLNAAEHVFEEVRLYDCNKDFIARIVDKTWLYLFDNYTVRTFWVFMDYFTGYTVIEITLNVNLNR